MNPPRKDRAAKESAHTVFTLILVAILASMSFKAFSSPLHSINNNPPLPAELALLGTSPSAELLKQNLRLQRLPIGLPLGGIKRITSLFGMRLHPIQHLLKQHTGVDLATERGTPVMSTGNGEVVKVDNVGGSGYGKYIEVRHSLGFSSIYGHLQRINVRVGDPVQAQQIMGLSGSSGSSTGPHLHYEIRYRDTPIDPLAFIKWASEKRDGGFAGDKPQPWAAKSS